MSARTTITSSHKYNFLQFFHRQFHIIIHRSITISRCYNLEFTGSCLRSQNERIKRRQKRHFVANLAETTCSAIIAGIQHEDYRGASRLPLLHQAVKRRV